MESAFNYKPAVEGLLRTTIEPNFAPPGTGIRPPNSDLRIAKNSEIPLLLRVAGHLTPEEDRSIQYHHLKSQPVYLGWPGAEVFECKFFETSEIKDGHPEVFDMMVELRKLLLRKKKGDTGGMSEFEKLMDYGVTEGKGYYLFPY